MRINGQCHCGKIELERTVDAANVMVCHCEDCQVFSRQPLEQLFFANVNLKLKGKIGRKSTSRQRLKVEIKESKHFAENECGSQLFGCNLDRSGYNVRIGCLDQRDSLSPVKHIFGTSAQKWVHNLDGCPWFKRGCNSETM